MDENTHYLKLCAAYVRGMAARNGTLELPASLTNPELSALALEAQADIVERGRVAGLKLHRFKRTTQLSRVRRVLGALRELAPENLLDVGSGRGVFLWPLLDAFPDLSVVSIDILDHRVAAIRAVIAGGWDSLQAASMNVTELDFDDGQFSVVTMLEVLEHISGPTIALREAVRVAADFVIVSVPSKEDSNPEHIHLFSAEDLEKLFLQAGARRVSFAHVPNHTIAIANIRDR